MEQPAQDSGRGTERAGGEVASRFSSPCGLCGQPSRVYYAGRGWRCAECRHVGRPPRTFGFHEVICHGPENWRGLKITEAYRQDALEKAHRLEVWKEPDGSYSNRPISRREAGRRTFVMG